MNVRKAIIIGILPLFIFLISILPTALDSQNNQKYPGYRATEDTFLTVEFDNIASNLRKLYPIPNDLKKIWFDWQYDFFFVQISGLNNVKGKEFILKINFKKNTEYESLLNDDFVSFEFFSDGNPRPFEIVNKNFLQNTLVLAVKEMEETPGTIEPKHEVPKTHTAKKGDTLYAIAKRYKITEEELMKWNNKKNLDLKTGDVLKLYPPENQNVAPQTKTVEIKKSTQQQSEERDTSSKAKDQLSKEIEIKDFSKIEKFLKGGGVFCYDDNNHPCGIKRVEEIEEGKLLVHKNTKKIEFQYTFLKGIPFTVSPDNKVDLDLRTQSFTPVEKIKDQPKPLNGVFYKFVYENENLPYGIFKEKEKNFTFTYPRQRENIKLLLQMDGYKEIFFQDISKLKDSSIIPMVVK